MCETIQRDVMNGQIWFAFTNIVCNNGNFINKIVHQQQIRAIILNKIYNCFHVWNNSAWRDERSDLICNRKQIITKFIVYIRKHCL